MKIKWNIIWLAMVFIVACKDKRTAYTGPAIKRDTTIVPANAYTRLLLDSSSVQRFVDSMVRDSATAAGIISFYNARNYQYAWFNEEGLTEQASAFWTIHQAATQTIENMVAGDSIFHAQMDSLVDGNSISLSGRQRASIELSLTGHFFRYISPTLAGAIRPADMQWYIPARKVDASAALDSFLTGKNPNWHPLGQRFYKLRSKLSEYARIQRSGGWPAIRPEEEYLKKGMDSAAVGSIRQRLQAGGYIGSEAALEEGIKKAQRSFGLPVTGVVNKELIEELNVPVSDRIRQMLINLQRLKWVPAEDSSYIMVNIPEYRLRVYHNDSVVSAMRIVVGQAAHHTVIFSGHLKYVVFSPYWNVPASIVRNEIMPAMKKDKNYLVQHRMEITGNTGGLPMIRQKPGGGNALGKVKFLFPNRFNIYLRDTPQRDLFEKDRRAFSHGCIRLQKPLELASLLLSGMAAWNEGKIRAAMDGGKEKWVTLQRPVPIYIVYLTSWVDNDGLLHFAKDIYGHDEEMGGHLFTN